MIDVIDSLNIEFRTKQLLVRMEISMFSVDRKLREHFYIVHVDQMRVYSLKNIIVYVML